MTEFLAQNNACGQSLLHIVATGNSVIAEILRLKDYIPDVYRLSTKADQTKYEEIILDFRYFKIAEAQELRIEQNEEILDLDNELRENYLDLLTRFYLAFESAHQYAADLRHFVNELNQDYYIQHTLESVLQDGEGKQLLCEALYIFGVILLLIDYHIPGIVRERLLIAYYRYSSASTSSSDSNIDDVCMLLRSTGFVQHNAVVAGNSSIIMSFSSSSPSSSKNKSNDLNNYPAAYFARFNFDQTFIEMVIGRLRCDDVYNQIAVYPLPEHRTTALANQAAMLYVCLYFLPSILHTQVPLMREIVDKFFADNWIVCLYMGVTVNLYDAWYHFKAARTALEPVLDTTQTVKGLCLSYNDKMLKTQKQANDILREGMLSDDLVLQHTTRIVQLIRQCNVLLRWYILHSTRPILEFSSAAWPKLRQVEQFIQKSLDDNNVLFNLLINCSQLELDVKEILRALIDDKEQRWVAYKKEATERIKELMEAFSGQRSLSKIESNPQLKLWFDEILKEVERLELKENPSKAGRMLIQLIQALEDVQEFHNLRTNMHVKQYLNETCDYFKKMIQIINIKEEVIVKIQLISDFSYAWCLIDRDFTFIMQESVKRQPKSVIRLRATFLKLASALEIPLLRINQAKSEDIISVSNYYSSELANYIRKVLQIIPESMFRTLAHIVLLQTEVLQEFPTRLEKEKLKSYAQFDDRYTIAKLTHSIAIFTEGILMMKRTLVGVIELNPKQLLEDGIRKELVRHLANALNVGLIIASRNTTKTKQQTFAAIEQLETKLTELAKTMNGYLRSFEYIQDYLGVHGLKILQEELKRIIYFNVERECNAYSRQKIQNWQSSYQSETIPIPTFPPLKDDPTSSINFIGRLAREIMHCTEPSSTIYLELKAVWYEKRAPHKILLVAQNFFKKLCEAIGPTGLVGLDRLYAVMILAHLNRNLMKIQNNLTSDKMWHDTLTELSDELTKSFPTAHLDAPLKFYASYHNRWIKVWPTLLEWLQTLGQLQILRQHLAFELQSSGKCNAKPLDSALNTFNSALLLELSNTEAYAKINNVEGSTVLKDINDYLKYFGFYEPLKEIFLLTKNSTHMALFWSLFTIAILPRWQYSENTQTLLTKNPKDTIDFGPHIVGLLTVLQQFHKDIKLMYLAYVCQYVALIVEANLSISNELSHDAVIALHYLHAFIRLAKLPRSLLQTRLPDIVLNQFEYLAQSNKKN